MTLPDAAPGYWLYETSGVLRPVVLAYLRGEDLDTRQCAIMRAYLRQWASGDWKGSAPVAALRLACDNLTTRAAIERWISAACALGMDPL